jgi:hypothetical protein
VAQQLTNWSPAGRRRGFGIEQVGVRSGRCGGWHGRYLLGHHRALEQRVLHSALAEFPILGTQLEQNIHALRANGIGLAVGIAGSLWGARGVTQAGQHSPNPTSARWLTWPSRSSAAPSNRWR